MNCPGHDRCELREFKGYHTCQQAGRCQSLVDASEQMTANASNAGRALGIFFMLALCALAVLLGD